MAKIKAKQLQKGEVGPSVLPEKMRRHRNAVIWLRASSAIGAFLLLSCSANTDPVRGVLVRVVDPDGQLASYRNSIDAVAASTVDEVVAALPISGVTVSIIADAAGAIGGYGLGGRTFGPGSISIYIDPAFPDLSLVLPERLALLLAHELHHARRFRGPGYGSTLLEAMISEGLADHFAVELLGLSLPPWSDAFSAEQEEELLILATPEFDSANYDHSAWFFVASAQLPRWTGYTLGYRMVQRYQQQHPGQSAAMLVDVPAADFLP